ncbi:MAG: energy transducer TonB [Thiotrichales bacterium]|nr:energy transducer TonB [Thiotrichales bacterium]
MIKPISEPTLPIANPVPVPTPTFSNDQIASAEKAYLSALRQEIMTFAQDTYPNRAKRRNWEGEVIILFTLHADGRISGLEMAESSGRPILDEAALSIITEKMRSRFKAFPAELQRDTWQIRVPVSYQLR